MNTQNDSISAHRLPVNSLTVRRRTHYPGYPLHEKREPFARNEAVAIASPESNLRIFLCACGHERDSEAKSAQRGSKPMPRFQQPARVSERATSRMPYRQSKLGL